MILFMVKNGLINKKAGNNRFRQMKKNSKTHLPTNYKNKSIHRSFFNRSVIRESGFTSGCPLT